MILQFVSYEKPGMMTRSTSLLGTDEAHPHGKFWVILATVGDAEAQKL